MIARLFHRRREHRPRLWPVCLVDVTTREVHYELGEWNDVLRRVVVRPVPIGWTR